MNIINLLGSIALQSEETGALVGSLVGLCCFLIIAVVFAYAAWKLYAKAGQPGWAGIVPFYNWYVGTQMAGRESWWVLLYWFLPFTFYMDLAIIFGKSMVFGIIMFFFPPLFLVLAFGDAEYQGPTLKGTSFY